MSDRPSPLTVRAEPAESAGGRRDEVLGALRRSSGRRQLFQRAGLVALAGGGAAVLGACADDSPSATPSAASPSAGASSAAPSSAAPSSGASSSPTASSSGSASSSASAVPAGTKVAKSQIPEGGGAIVDQKYVVTQPTAGEFKAFTNICTHQGCPVARVTGGEIVCDCHGSHFSITTGEPVSGPAFQRATGALGARTVVVSGNDVYVSG